MRALEGSRIRDVHTGNKKPNFKIRCTFLKVLVSEAGSMVLAVTADSVGGRSWLKTPRSASF